MFIIGNIDIPNKIISMHLPTWEQGAKRNPFFRNWGLKFNKKSLNQFYKPFPNYKSVMADQIKIGHYILGKTIGTGGFAKVKGK